MKIMGLDIGGANTDCAIIEINDEKQIKSIKKSKEYLPMWIENDKLPECLLKLSQDDLDSIDVVCVTMTAELADSYESKTEGVLDISKKVMTIFNDKIVKFVTFDGLKSYDDILGNPLNAAAANWVGTSNAIKYIKNNCIFMDMGTTTTDIIPIINKQNIAKHTDVERLGSGELVYTGMLRTNIATIVHSIPIYNIDTSVSSELFTITADVHRILGNITQEEYTCNTPDNKDKDIVSCKRRLSRLVCADLDSLTDETINNMAQYIYKKQVNQVLTGLIKVVEKTGLDTVVISDFGHGNICKNAAKQLGLNIINIDEYISKEATSIITTIGAIQMYVEEYISQDFPLIQYI